MDFTGRFTKIKGVSNIRRLPRRGKIGLGIKKPAPDFGIKDVEYFILPEELKPFLGEKPTELNIVFPLSGLDEKGLPDLGGIYPQALKLYGSSKGLKCKGDGETAMRANDKGVFEEVDECPCPLFGAKNGCKKVGTLSFFINHPEITMGGVYAIDSGSWNSLVDVQSGIALALEMLRNPFTGEYNSIAMLPFKLRRVFKMIKHGNRQDKHWPLTCELDLPLSSINRIRQGVPALPRAEVLRIEGDVDETREEIQQTGHDKESISTAVIDKVTGEVKETAMGPETGDGTPPERPYQKPTKAEIAADAKKKVEAGKVRAKEIQARIDKKKKEEEEALEDREAEVEAEAEQEAPKVIDGKEKERILKEAADKFVGANIIGWKYVSFYACLADVIQPGTSTERLQDIICQDDKVVDKIIAVKVKRDKEK